MRSLLLAVFLALVIVPSPVGANADPALQEGLSAYFSGRFDEAAVELKRALRAGGDRPGAEFSPATAYFLGRAVHELGLRGLALHYLGQAERAAGVSEWRLAQREVARIYFRAAEYPAVVEVFHGLRPEEQDGEIAYLAGISAAMQSQWSAAQEILGRVGLEDPLHPHALYARAQARAAAGDSPGALADLAAVKAMAESLPPGLADQTRILEGKLLYLEGRENEARRSFSAVERQGAFAFEAVRGLLLTGGSAEETLEFRTTGARPEASATLLLLRAVAAENRDDASGAAELREKLREVAASRLKEIERLAGSEGSAKAALESDLARFANLLNSRRWAAGCAEERKLLPASIAASRLREPPLGSFQPADGVFTPVWDQARADPWLRGLIEILARADTLDRDLQSDSEERSRWIFWRRHENERPRLALRVIRTANLRQMFEDHRHTFRASEAEPLRAAKSESIEHAVVLLGRLYRGGAENAPAALSNLEKALDYKRADMLRLIESVPERATDPVISLLGNYVDLLAEMRERLEVMGEAPPSARSTRSEILADLRNRNAVLRSEVAREIHRAILPTLRREMAFFTRIEADNEGSLSKLYARTGVAGERGRGR